MTVTPGSRTRLTFMGLQSFKGNWSNLIVLILPGVVRIRSRLQGCSVRSQPLGRHLHPAHMEKGKCRTHQSIHSYPNCSRMHARGWGQKSLGLNHWLSSCLDLTPCSHYFLSFPRAENKYEVRHAVFVSV